MIEKDIKKFIKSLAECASGQDFINQYSFERTENAIRRKNLHTYLSSFTLLPPKILLVGEAPGYRGCRRTGVPFSSEKLIKTNKFFTSNPHYEVENIKIPYDEQGANSVWKLMDELDFYPLIWSAFPFHSHQLQNTESNRRPSKEELKLGKKFLKQLINIYNIEIIVSVGRVAQESLTDLGVTSKYVRHPSHGGQALFKEGLTNMKRDISN